VVGDVELRGVNHGNSVLLGLGFSMLWMEGARALSMLVRIAFPWHDLWLTAYVPAPDCQMRGRFVMASRARSRDRSILEPFIRLLLDT
jgi:hypothetical protein